MLLFRCKYSPLPHFVNVVGIGIDFRALCKLENCLSYILRLFLLFMLRQGLITLPGLFLTPLYSPVRPSAFNPPASDSHVAEFPGLYHQAWLLPVSQL